MPERTVNETYVVGKEEVYKPVMRCLERPAKIYHQLAHECIVQAPTLFQNYLMPLRVPKGKVVCKDSRVGVQPANEELMKPLTETLKAQKAALTQGLIQFFKQALEDFKEMRLCPVRFVDPNVPLFGTTHEAPEMQQAKVSAIGNALQANVVAIQILDQLVLIATKWAKSILCNVEGKVRAAQTDEMKHTALLEYVSAWEDYFASALELQTHLQPLADAVNDATAVLLPDIHKKHELFSIWATLTIVFKAYCYLPLRCHMDSCLLARVTKLGDDYLSYLMRPEVPEGGSLENDGGAVKLAAVESDFAAISRIFQARLDLGLNEIQVHYIYSKTLSTDPTDDIMRPLEANLQKACESAAAKYGNSDKLVTLFTDLNDMLQNIFPPCLWDRIEATIEKSILVTLRNLILPAVKKFSPLPIDKKRAEVAEIVEQPGAEKIIAQVKEIRNPQGSRYLTGEASTLFPRYLFKLDPALHASLVGHIDRHDDAKKGTRRVEDTEIEIKNRFLGIVQNKETELFLALSTPTKEQVKASS